MRIDVVHIGELIFFEKSNEHQKKYDFHSLKNAFVSIENGTIKSFGQMCDYEKKSDYSVDAKGGMVMPAYCDSHTHIVFSASRENEFLYKIQGLTYEEIAARGGGILNSAEKLRHTPEEDLVQSAYTRIQNMTRHGTCAIEIKSGYGLSVESELKMLRVIKKLKQKVPHTIKATFLGAHAIPLAFKNDRKAYINLLKNELIPEVAKQNLAEYCDVFCEKGFFTPDETADIISEGIKYGLKPKIHANQLSYSQGIQVGVQFNAVSVDHLEYTGEDEINCLLNSNTVPTVLPSASFYLNMPYPPARKMIDAGLQVALATDYNPGSSPSGNMNLVISLACIKMKMTPEEALLGATIYGARAMELEHSHGNIAIGHKANLIVTKQIPSLAYIPYSFGENCVQHTFVNGVLYST